MNRAVDHESVGARFRVFPQAPFLEPGRAPETIIVSPPAGSIGPGPSDQRMYVIDPVGKEQPYGPRLGSDGRPYLALPPWPGDVFPPAIPNAAGHFDEIEIASPEFEAAHVYASVRRTLDIWERYFGHTMPWHFGADYDRLEITLLRHLDNAMFGYGFMEVGAHFTHTGEARSFALNFDVLAHEIGHAIVYSRIGVPTPVAEQGEYFGFQESAADIVAMIAVLHFESVVDELLENTHGNLYAINRLNRIGEVSHTDQIRMASNPVTLGAFIGGWEDEHDLSLPLTGAVFDTLVDIFHEELVLRGLIEPQVENLADALEYRPGAAEEMQAMFDRAYRARLDGFKAALLDARDTMGYMFAGAIRRLSADYLGYDDVGQMLLEADIELSGGVYRQIIINNLRKRGVGLVTVGPRLPGEADHDIHSSSARTIVPWPPVQVP